MILRNNFAEFWKRLEDEYPAVVIIIDEAESLERIEGALGFLREVFQRLSHESKYMIVLSGKLNFPQRMSESFSPLNRFFPPAVLTPFDAADAQEYIECMLAFVKVTPNAGAKKKIYEKSEGHPNVLVKMCKTVFGELYDQETHITLNHVEKSFPRIELELEQEFFNPMFHPVSPKAKINTYQLLRIGKKKFKFTEAVKATQMEGKNLAPYVQELVRKGCLNKPERATSEFFHVLFLEFLQKRAPGELTI